MLKHVDNNQVEVLLTLIVVVVAGFFVGNHDRAFAMSEKTRGHVDTFWELIDEILNVVLFLLFSLDLLVWWCSRFLSGARR